MVSPYSCSNLSVYSVSDAPQTSHSRFISPPCRQVAAVTVCHSPNACPVGSVREPSSSYLSPQVSHTYSEYPSSVQVGRVTLYS